MEFFAKVLQSILGGVDPVLYVACMIMAYTGMLLRVFYFVMRRDPHSADTPTSFSPAVFWYENWKRIVFNLIFLPVVLIFSTAILGGAINTFLALGAGLGSDTLATKVFSPSKERDKT